MLVAFSQERLRQDWHAFVNGNGQNCNTVRKNILESWERCAKFNLDPYQRTVPVVLNDDDLAIRRSKNREWLETARPVMANLYEFVAGSGFVVTIADSDAYILEIIGDFDVVHEIARGNFRPGANWSEKSAGTNGIGTTLVEGKPLQIISYEHYCICSHHWTGSAAPIHDADGRQVGVLLITGSHKKVYPHTLGMVVAGADSVKRHLAMEKFWRERDRAYQVSEALMESISEGILATDDEEKVIHINKEALNYLGVTPEQAVGRDIREVLGVKGGEWEAVIKGQKFKTDWEQNINTPSGPFRVTVTSRPVRTNDGCYDGIVIVLNDIARARKLVQRMSGAVAKLTFKDMVGKNPKFQKSLGLAKAAAESDSTVLLLGESGTGKDVMAQAIHNSSNRSKGPFVAINCGAIPRELIGSELFGYTEGAFTGAKKGGSPGKFELADGGTIFLDEIGDMPTDLQTTLLRVLEQKAITRIGGTNVIPINVRVIAATNRNLFEEVERGNFRRDLYYRLNVISIRLVPLRERQEDKELLWRHFLERLCKQLDKNITEIDEKVWTVVKAYRWPGNVRELQNVIERALHVINGPVLRLEHLSDEIQREHIASNANDPNLSVPDYEKKVILSLLAEYQGNLTRVAGHLGIARTTLLRRMIKHGLQKKYPQFESTAKPR